MAGDATIKYLHVKWRRESLSVTANCFPDRPWNKHKQNTEAQLEVQLKQSHGESQHSFENRDKSDPEFRRQNPKNKWVFCLSVPKHCHTAGSHQGEAKIKIKLSNISVSDQSKTTLQTQQSDTDSDKDRHADTKGTCSEKKDVLYTCSCRFDLNDTIRNCQTEKLPVPTSQIHTENFPSLEPVLIFPSPACHLTTELDNWSDRGGCLISLLGGQRAVSESVVGRRSEAWVIPRLISRVIRGKMLDGRLNNVIGKQRNVNDRYQNRNTARCMMELSDVQ